MTVRCGRVLTAGVDAGKGYYGTGHRAQIADFLDAVRTGRKPFVTARSPRLTVDAILAIYESQQSGTWVTFGRERCANGESC